MSVSKEVFMTFTVNFSVLFGGWVIMEDLRNFGL